MALSLQNFNQWVQQQAAAMQASASAALNFNTGSVLRAIVEANASVALWMQWLLLQLLALTRASTSNGSDLDSWMADFSFARLPAVAATGAVTFARYSTGTAALIVPGVQTKTIDGTQVFTVTTDTTNAAWNASLGGYVMSASASSITVPIVAAVAGSGGNVAAGSIGLITSAIAGVDTVTNATALTNGLDAETDAAFRARFVTYIQTRSLATPLAVGYAVNSVQQGLTYSVIENYDNGLTYHPGNFLVFVDDGSGAPSASLLAAVRLAVEAVRPIGNTFAVFAPTTLKANVSGTLTTAAGYIHADLVAAADNAVFAYIAALPMGAVLPVSRLAQVIYDVSPGITNVSNLLVNGAATDLGGYDWAVVRPGSVVLS